MSLISCIKSFPVVVIKRCFFLFLCLLSVNLVVAQNDTTYQKGYILVINAYTEATSWSSRMISTITRFVAEDPQLAVYTEHMNMMLIDDDAADLEEFKSALFERYGAYPPRLLLLLGDPALLLKEDFKRVWGDIPMVLCAEKDYTGPDEYYLHKEVIPQAERIPMTELADPYNLVLLYSDLYIRKNVELISQMTPDMKKFIFIGDERFINVTNGAEVREIIRKKYPHVEYEYLSPQILPINLLIDSLYRVDAKTTGILFSSWYYKRTFAGNTSLVTNAYKVITTVSAPLFVLNTVGVTTDGGMVGGYVHDWECYDKELIRILSEVLEGRQPRDIPFYRSADGMPVINYKALLRKDISPSLCPENTRFLNKPLTFWEQYHYFILGASFCILMLVLFFTFRIRTLKRLREIQQKEIDTMADYKNLVNNMPILYMQEELVLNKAGIPVDMIYRNVNSHFENNFFRREDAVGKKASELFPESLPEFLHFTQKALAENRAITFPYYFKKIDTFYDVVLKGTRTSGIIDVFCMDSTDLHKAQQKLSTTNNKLAMALDVANIVPWKWDLISKTILCDINRPIELSTVGGDVAEEQLAVPDSQYFSKIYKKDRKRVEQAYHDLIEGKSDKVKEEYRVVNVENHVHKIDWVEAQAAVQERDEEGNPVTLIGSSQVITNRKKMELELTTAKDRAEESNRLKSAFLANMSHEIRTPLNAIVGFSGILASTEEEQEKQEYVSIIENNNELLLQLISDILDLSKIEAGTLEFHYSNVELNSVMKELESVLQLKLKSDAVRLEFVPSLDICPVHIEKNRLSQLLINLITNAIKFTSEGSVRFGYELQGKELYFYVSDTGCGIPKDKQESIFGRFVKLNNFAQGTGLGLSICQTLVNHMGGCIGVESEEGNGATFWFTLPYKPAGQEELSEKKEYQPISVEKDKLSILIAEDNDSNYKLFESILKNDYQLIHAWDGQEAVDLFRKEDPQIILMDINMPVMDGYEAAQEIRKYSAKVPIIAITAFAYASDEQRVMESGFDGYMPKPINARQLRAQIKDIMQKRIVLL